MRIVYKEELNLSNVKADDPFWGKQRYCSTTVAPKEFVDPVCEMLEMEVRAVVQYLVREEIEEWLDEAR